MRVRRARLPCQRIDAREHFFARDPRALAVLIEHARPAARIALGRSAAARSPSSEACAPALVCASSAPAISSRARASPPRAARARRRCEAAGIRRRSNPRSTSRRPPRVCDQSLDQRATRAGFGISAVLPRRQRRRLRARPREPQSTCESASPAAIATFDRRFSANVRGVQRAFALAQLAADRRAPRAASVLGRGARASSVRAETGRRGSCCLR